MTMMQETFFLVLRESGRTFPRLGARLTSRRPKLDAGEVVVELDLAVPAALFKRPTLRARVSVPEGEGQGTKVISAQVQEDIGRHLSEQLGMLVRVEVTDTEVTS